MEQIAEEPVQPQDAFDFKFDEKYEETPQNQPEPV